MGENNSRDWRTLPSEYQWRFCTEGYLAHPDGIIKSVDRWVMKNGKKILIKGKELKPYLDEDGYAHVALSIRGRAKRYAVHRLIAQTFIPNPNNLPQVNHKDENPSNNNVDNLEWCTLQYNIRYGTRTVRMAETNSKPVVGVNPKNGEVVVEFPSTQEAGRNGYTAGHICVCCNGGKRKSHKGLLWYYKSDMPIEGELKKTIKHYKGKDKPVQGINPDTGEVVVEFPSASECGRKGYNQGHVSACCRGEEKSHKGLIWRYK